MRAAAEAIRMMRDWLVAATGLDASDALMLLSLTGDLAISQIVDPEEDRPHGTAPGECSRRTAYSFPDGPDSPSAPLRETIGTYEPSIGKDQP